MTSTYTSSNRLDKPAQGDYYNTWATWWASTAGMIDEATDGYVAVTVNSTKTLSTANGATDEARNRVLGCTGTGGTLTIPAVEKAYLIVNGCSANLTVTCGTGATATVLQGASAWVYCTSAATYNAGHLGNQDPVLLSTTNITAVSTINVTLPSGFRRFVALVTGATPGALVTAITVGADATGTGFSDSTAASTGTPYYIRFELNSGSNYADYTYGQGTTVQAITLVRKTQTARAYNNMSFVSTGGSFTATGTIKLYGIL